MHILTGFLFDLKRLFQNDHMLKISSRAIYSISLFWLLLTGSGRAEKGIPYIRNYTPKEYGGHFINWAVTQDRRGVTYVANHTGILEYDGVNWRTIPTSGNSTMRHLACAADGRVYVGGHGNFGYLTPDSLGQIRFISLRSKIPEPMQAFTDVWQVLPTSNGIFFETDKYLFQYTPSTKPDCLPSENSLRVIPATTRFQRTFLVRDQLYVRQDSLGLMIYRDGSLQTVPGGNFFANERIDFILPYDSVNSLLGKGVQGLLIGVRNLGLVLYDGQRAKPFPTAVDAMLIAGQMAYGIVLPNGDLAIATRQEGLIVLDHQGQLRYHLTKVIGLQNDAVRHIYADTQGGLWLALDKGVSRVEIGTPLSLFDERLGLKGTINDVVRHQGDLYVATRQGIFRLQQNQATGFLPQFTPVEGIRNIAWSLLPVGASLLAATGDGVFEIAGGQARRIKNYPVHAYTLHGSATDSSQVFLGLLGGLAVLQQRNGQWQEIGQAPGLDAKVLTITESADGYLWLGTFTDGLIRLANDSRLLVQPNIERYTTVNGLPDSQNNIIYPARYKDIIATEAGIYRFDPKEKSFAPDTDFNRIFQEKSGHIPKKINCAYGDTQGNIWLYADDEAGVAVRQTDGSYRWEYRPFRRLADFGTITTIFRDDFGTAYPARRGEIWFGSTNGLIHYDGTAAMDYTLAHPVLIRSVTTGKNGLIFGGCQLTPANALSPAQESPGDVAADSADISAPAIIEAEAIELPYRQNRLRFSFALPNYNDESQNRYQCRLEGFDDNWTEWTNQTTQEYTNLSEGNYTFRVKGCNIFGHESRESVYRFIIHPPWYRTGWFYSLALLIFAGLFVATLKSYAAYHARHHRAALEKQKLISERLEKANTHLEEVGRYKDEILANTTHELRTPLNGIIGIAESLIDGATGALSDETKRNLAMISYSGRLLYSLVNDILDYSQLKNRRLHLQRKSLDLAALTDVVMTLSGLQIGSRPITLINQIDPKAPLVHADENRIQQVLFNLINNAIKFTDSGSITVGATPALPTENHSELVICVADTGIGIPVEKQGRIFESFEQADASIAREYGGAGLGLSVTKQLVELHGGRIWVESQPGAGSKFYFTLPVSQETQPEAAVHILTDQVSRPISKVQPQSIPAEPQTNSGGIHFHILIVDDEPINLQVLKNYLVVQDYRVTLATSGPEAIHLIQQQRNFDLIILDVMMPKMSGYEVCRRIREDQSLVELPIMLLTVKNFVSDLIAGFEAGANDYLPKPFDKNELLARVRTLLTLSKLTRTNHVLREANELKSQLLRMAAHDLKSPLTVIMGLAEVIQSIMAPDEPAGQMSGAIFNSSQRMLNMIETLLDSARIESGQLLLEKQVIDLNTTARPVIELYRLAAAKKQQQINFDLGPEGKCLAEADPGRVKQIIENLISNAIKYSPPEKTIAVAISLRYDDRLGLMTRLTVKDEGPGLTEDDKQKLFGKFQRLSARPTGQESSTGLGLSIAKQLVDLHDGRLWVDSVHGQGATFILELKAVVV